MGSFILDVKREVGGAVSYTLPLVSFDEVRCMRALAFAATCAAVMAHSLSGQTSSASIIPRPEQQTPGTGEFTLTARTIIYADRADSAVAARFARSIAPATGFEV